MTASPDREAALPRLVFAPGALGHYLHQVAIDFDAHKLRKALASSGKTIGQVARDLGVSRQAVHEYVTGRGRPALERLVPLADSVGVHPRALFSNVPPADYRPDLSTLLLLAELLGKHPRALFSEAKEPPT